MLLTRNWPEHMRSLMATRNYSIRYEDLPPGKYAFPMKSTEEWIMEYYDWQDKAKELEAEEVQHTGD
jgi:hypothetical protein